MAPLGRLWSAESGKANSKTPTVVALLLIAFIVYLGTKFIPVYSNNSTFKEKVAEAVNWDRFFQGAHPPTPDTVRTKIVELAQKYEIPLKDDKLFIEQLEDGRIKVQITYTKAIEFPLYGTYKWNVEFINIQESR